MTRQTSSAPGKAAKKLRCAIYTRKSSEEGLEQDFNSLDAQREACTAFIASQKHEGWTTLPEMYDDGGFSGATIERPAFQRLLADVGEGKIDVVVVYKVDRLTRSLSDFAKIVDIFDRRDVSFVSVTQQFNTTTSMGRLTLNILLSFAQFEREVTGERIRDKIAASKKKGMWMGGLPSLGYDIQDRKLVINEAEAKTVQYIFRRYTELKSVRLLKADLDAQGIVSKSRKASDGTRYGEKPIARGALYLMLQNRIYRGEIVHKDKNYPGEHEAIIDEALWSEVQAILAGNRADRILGTKRSGVTGRSHSGDERKAGQPADWYAVRCARRTDDPDACDEKRHSLPLLHLAGAACRGREGQWATYPGFRPGGARPTPDPGLAHRPSGHARYHPELHFGCCNPEAADLGFGALRRDGPRTED